MKKAVAIAMLLGLTAILPSAVAQSPDGAGDELLIFRMGTTNNIDSLNPFKIVEIPSYELADLYYNQLVEFDDEDYGPAPALAESWETSEDGLTWTYHLNPDARWSDGEPVTSEDVEYTFDRVIEEKQALYIDYLRQIETIESPDEHTIVMTTKEPSVQMLSLFVYILPKHIWEDVPADETKSFRNDPVVGSGPFQAVEWRRGQFVRLERNPHWFGKEPAVDEIIMQFYDNPDTMVQALKQGDVDYIYSPPLNLFKSLENQPDITAVSAPDPGFTELGFNLYEPTPEAIDDFGAPETSTGHPALLDPLVREAINWAIDEQGLTDKVLAGEGVPGSTVVPPVLAKYHLELSEEEKFGFDLDRASELLSEAGWEDTNGNGTVDKDGEELELRLFGRSESADTTKSAQFIEGWLEEAGIGVETKAVSDNTLTDDIYAADFDMFIWGWGSDPDPDFILSVLSCDQIMGWSDTFWCDEDYSQMYLDQKTQLDIDQRVEMIQEMQRIAYEANPYVIFFYDNQFEAYRTDRFTGWTPTPASIDVGQVAFNSSNSTYLNLKPVGDEAASDGGGGTSPIVWIAVGGGVAALIAGVVLFERRGSEEDRA
ncbi:MAG: ABC transporter substrate-binding protein [Actinomycetota bacterium]